MRCACEGHSCFVGGSHSSVGQFVTSEFRQGRLEFRILTRGAAMLVLRRVPVLCTTHGIPLKLTLLDSLGKVKHVQICIDYTELW